MACDEGIAEHLAAQLELTVGAFVVLFGAGWARAPGADALETGWYVAGDPAQLMLMVSDDGVRLARPRGRWHGASELVFEPVTECRIPAAAFSDSDLVHTVVANLLRRRRSAFRYCPYCRELTPPEYWHGAACMGCASRWHGVVY